MKHLSTFLRDNSFNNISNVSPETSIFYRKKNCQIFNGRPLVPEKRSPLQTIAVVCVKLDEGESEEKIMEYLEIEDDLFTFCVEFALENNLIIRQDGRFKITIAGKEFVSAF